MRKRHDLNEKALFLARRRSPGSPIHHFVRSGDGAAEALCGNRAMETDLVATLPNIQDGRWCVNCRRLRRRLSARKLASP